VPGWCGAVTTSSSVASADLESLAEVVGDLAKEHGRTVATAESLTGGAIAEQLAKARESGTWFAGGVVAYTNETKYRALAVPRGPVVTADAAAAMAKGVLDLTGADAAVSVTGVGGPGEEEGKPSGTVFLATATADDVRVLEHHFPGEPDQVVEETIEAALRELIRQLEEL